MRAAYYTRQGAARDVLQVGEQPTPEPRDGEVRVRLRTSGVNPSDWKVRRGGFGRSLSAPLIIPHSDGAGDIDAIGPGVTGRSVGERVWIWNGQWKRPHGTAAEYIVVPSAQAAPLPDGVGYDEGGCLGIPALTALQAVRLAGVGPGTAVLVAGGAGSVAHYAIQFAKLRGAVVHATVSSAPKAAHARAAGADTTIDYRTEDVAARVRDATSGRGVDAVIEVDLSSNAGLYPAIVRPHGRVAVYGMSAPETALPALWMMQNTVSLLPFLIYEISPADRAAGLQEVDRLLAAGKLRHTVARRLPLERIADAHDLVESGAAIGNVVLEI